MKAELGDPVPAAAIGAQSAIGIPDELHNFGQLSSEIDAILARDEAMREGTAWLREHPQYFWFATRLGAAASGRADLG
ncbi:hypothetical protein BC360_27190 [Ensifer sp. LC163]|nr:hypothetical protein BC360_27190 [Ensifer sp. LC163]